MKHSLAPIGILGGTFDPIHLGHCRTALDLYQGLKLREVRFIPCKQPVHKAGTRAEAEDRAMMVKLAIQAEPGLVLDRRELDRDTPSYMVETLQSLRQEQGEKQPLCLILGMDALAGLNTWHHWEEIMELAHIIAIHRPDFSFQWQGPVADLLKLRLVGHADALFGEPAGRILLQSTTLLNISATDIRQLIQHGQSPRYLLPEPVLDYIYQKKLYFL